MDIGQLTTELIISTKERRSCFDIGKAQKDENCANPERFEKYQTKI